MRIVAKFGMVAFIAMVFPALSGANEIDANIVLLDLRQPIEQDSCQIYAESENFSQDTQTFSASIMPESGEQLGSQLEPEQFPARVQPTCSNLGAINAIDV